MLGIFGGTGLYKIDGIRILKSQLVETPFGAPSAEITIGEMRGQKIAFLPRHGVHHQLLPSEINFRANIWAMKSVGVKKIMSVSAVGSLHENIRPGDLVLPEQYFDWTKGKRQGTFFGEGMVAHISTANPTCPSLRHFIKLYVEQKGAHIHVGKTYACVDGPRLGTRAESLFLKQIGCDVVGMTNIPEAFLAREAQLCYATIAIATDYDCWLDDPAQHASVEKVMEFYRTNLGKIQELIPNLVGGNFDSIPCECRSALRHAVLTDEKLLSGDQRQMLACLRE